MAARSAWSEECKGRGACREDDVGRVLGQGLQGHSGECKGMRGRGMQEVQGLGCAGAQRHAWTEGLKGCGIQRARAAGMQGNAFMEDGARKVDAIVEHTSLHTHSFTTPHHPPHFLPYQLLVLPHCARHDDSWGHLYPSGPTLLYR